MLLAMLFRNQTILKIDYTVANNENIKRLKQFSELKHLDADEIEMTLEMDHSHEDIETW